MYPNVLTCDEFVCGKGHCMACFQEICGHFMSQFVLEDKVCHFLIGDDSMMLIYLYANMLT